MILRFSLAALATLVVATPVCAQSAAQDDAPWPAPATRAPAAAPQPKQTSTGLCTILRDDKVVDQQNCRAVAGIEPGGSDLAKSITYVWPTGNRTVVGGSEEDFSVNGNLAVPLPDKARGLCLKVEKTGNTFCYKEGAKVKAAAAQPAPTTPAMDARKAEKPTELSTNIAGAAMTATAATAAASPRDALGEETKLRKAAEDEIKTLKAEIARLTEAEEKRLAEAAELRKQSEAEEKKRAAESEAEKTRVASVLKEFDAVKARCATRDAAACERALVLAKEAWVTGSLDNSGPEELQRLHAISQAPFGIPSLAFLGGIPRSTWAASSIAAFLALTLLVMMGRRYETSSVSPHHKTHAMPSLDTLPLVPSLDPFAETVSVPPTGPADPLARLTPPPLPDLSSLRTKLPFPEQV